MGSVGAVTWTVGVQAAMSADGNATQNSKIGLFMIRMLSVSAHIHVGMDTA